MLFIKKRRRRKEPTQAGFQKLESSFRFERFLMVRQGPPSWPQKYDESTQISPWIGKLRVGNVLSTRTPVPMTKPLFCYWFGLQPLA